MRRGDSSTDPKRDKFVSTWQYIRDGAIILMGILAIIMQIILMTKLKVNYGGAGIWFGIVAIFGGASGVLANRRKTRMFAFIWMITATATMLVSIGPMYYSALGWMEGGRLELNLMEATSGVLFFCGMLSAIFSLFAACGACLYITDDYFEKRQRSSPRDTHVVQYY